jgi:hypothetical protein
MGLGHSHTVAGPHTVSACARGHGLRPMGNAMPKAARHTRAARHVTHHWIPQNPCDACHSDYGLHGNLQAKREGARHLARSPTRPSQEPITIRGPFHHEHGLTCHQGMPRFEAVQSPPSVRVWLEQSAMRGLNGHGQAHPSREQRPPGSADYVKRMEAGR